MKKKILSFLLFLLIGSGFYAFDYIRSLQYAIDVVSISPQPAPADGQSPVQITLKLTDRNGKPIAGHSLFAFPLDGGMLKANREKTDHNGEAKYTYYPYRASEIMKLNDVSIQVIDESNSVFLEVNAKKEFTVQLKAPPKQEDSGNVLDDIFGDE